MELTFAFAIFFISLGPLKVIPLFFLHTKDETNEEIRKIAIKGVLFAFGILLVVTLIADQLMKQWRLSLPAFILSGGILLFLTSFANINKFKGLKSIAPPTPSKKTEEVNNDMIKHRALSPVAIPIIISPLGVVAVISFVSLAHMYSSLMEVIGVLVLIMLLDLIAMIFARFIMIKVGLPIFSILGWVLSILQAGLAVQIVVNSIHKLF